MPDLIRFIVPDLYVYGALAIVLLAYAGDATAAALVAGLAYLSQLCSFTWAAGEFQGAGWRRAANSLLGVAVVVWVAAWAWAVVG